MISWLCGVITAEGGEVALADGRERLERMRTQNFGRAFVRGTHVGGALQEARTLCQQTGRARQLIGTGTIRNSFLLRRRKYCPKVGMILRLWAAGTARRNDPSLQIAARAAV